MKHFLSLLVVFFLLFSCTENDKRMHVTGQVKGLKKGTLLLQKIEDTLLISVDSVSVHGDSSFEFSEEIDNPQMYYLYVRLKDGTLRDDRISFFAEPTEITINTTLDNFAVDAIITGSKNEEVLNEYKRLTQRYATKNLDYLDSHFNALQDGNDSLVKAIEKLRNDLVASKYLMTINFALNHNDLELAPYLMISEVPKANIKYLDTVYKTLTPKIKDSKYGKVLESFIRDSKKVEN
jgi:hypothetical protein